MPTVTSVPLVLDLLSFGACMHTASLFLELHVTLAVLIYAPKAHE